ncbi:MAG TPA: hypothetical protein VMV72_05620 [Verrucomicrobiae bacterium]|nr:hypothetical protein [Verrucomicrobiae bacterium]
MKLSNVHHPSPKEAHPATLLLWLMFCVSVWLLGFTLAMVIIEKLYFR